MNTLPIEIGLHAVIVAIDKNMPVVLTVNELQQTAPVLDALPFGPFAPDHHRTLERGLRQWVEMQTRLNLGYVEQLYTFGDRGRLDDVQETNHHFVSIGYLALVRFSNHTADFEKHRLSWNSWYRHFPWEDWRAGIPNQLADIINRLEQWAGDEGEAHIANSQKPDRLSRLRLAFSYNKSHPDKIDRDLWDEERVLERYELMYEAGLVSEAVADGRLSAPLLQPSPGSAMAHDHRRILATAMARLRGKLKYRPIVFELLEESFTLTELQQTVEMLSGRLLHKQNFRRLVENAQLVEPTGARTSKTGGRPAAYFRFRKAILNERPAPGLKF